MDKTHQVIYKIISSHPSASITVIMKLAYIIDLIATRDLGKQITDLKYKRYFYGPFDSKVYEVVEDLISTGFVKSNTKFTIDNDYFVFDIDKEFSDFDNLEDKEVQVISDVLAELSGYGAKTLTEIAYKTKPMIKLGATLGGNENLDVELDLSANGK